MRTAPFPAEQTVPPPADGRADGRADGDGRTAADDAGPLRVRVETPENIVLELPVAGLLHRAGAWVVDFTLRAVVVIGLLFPLSFVAAFGLGGAVTGVFLLVMFVSEWGYFTACEAFFGGRTPGKALFRLRVVRTDGGPVTFWPALVRNLLRFADSLPLGFNLLAFRFSEPPHLLEPGALPLYGVAALCCVLSPRGQRVGDLFAGTLVIRTNPATVPKQPVILDKIAPIDRSLIAGPRPPRRTLAAVDEYLARRGVLDHRRGHQIALPLALAVARRLKYAGDPDGVRVYPMAFLARVWATYLRPDREDDEAPRVRRGDLSAEDADDAPDGVAELHFAPKTEAPDAGTADLDWPEPARRPAARRPAARRPAARRPAARQTETAGPWDDR